MSVSFVLGMVLFGISYALAKPYTCCMNNFLKKGLFSEKYYKSEIYYKQTFFTELTIIIVIIIVFL